MPLRRVAPSGRAFRHFAIAPASHATHAFAAQLLGDSLKMLHRSILSAFSRRSLGGRLRRGSNPSRSRTHYTKTNVTSTVVWRNAATSRNCTLGNKRSPTTTPNNTICPRVCTNWVYSTF